MGLTHQSTGRGVLAKQGHMPGAQRVVALAGNPNVGKSTVFNALTGMNQHTGNWPGKTVANARGNYTYQEQSYELVDLPGTYSLMASSVEEEIARDFICFDKPDTTVVVADATCLERNLNLVLQILEVTGQVVVCVNLLDEARKKGISIDLNRLSALLGVPVVGTSARQGEGLDTLMEQVARMSFGKLQPQPLRIDYDRAVEDAIDLLLPAVRPHVPQGVSARFICLKLLDMNDALHGRITQFLGVDPLEDPGIAEALEEVEAQFARAGITAGTLRERVVGCIVHTAEDIYHKCAHLKREQVNLRDRRLDRILTSKATGIPVMLLLLGLIFWITISGANVPSQMLGDFLFSLEVPLAAGLTALGLPAGIVQMLSVGMYRTLAWVVSVMLPPMAIFFPLFTLLEDSGYLPRIAFNMDAFFKKARAHGKQALTMCMGFGCNACGVIGCRIIDSPRERLIAILTNNFVPCNGRFPTLIAIITMFFVGVSAGFGQSVLSALMLTGVIVLGVAMTLWISRLLSKTVLKGVPSSFALELPPYRRPQIGKVILRSIFDRTLFVLGRAVAVAAPAGIVIWCMANIQVGEISLLAQCAGFLDPFARLMGLDGFILMAFILGFPANEIVMPIVIMSYMATGGMMEFESLGQLHALLLAHGWTWVTALCTMLFSLLHFPCATTCWTIRKETKSTKWTLLAFALPTVVGVLGCILVNLVGQLLL